MSIRFKFRSSVNFDTIELNNKPYISVASLRSKIMNQKKLCNKDFDLVFYDDVTGQEYNDDEFKLASGSSVIIKRVPAEPVLRPHKLEASEISEDIPKGTYHNKPEEIVLEKKVAPEDREQIKLEKVANANGVDLHKVDLPSELRCPICNTYFKEAVMIPCCQHSFCKKCISEVLTPTARCPKCSSTKYRVEHLLPNLSLRHAIEHFLESQILASAPETDLQKYVPDGESGIQGKEVSAVTKRKLDLLYSTSAMDKGSNLNMAESVYESQNRKNAFLEGTGFHTGNSCAIDLLNRNGGRYKHDDLAPFADSQGENQPIMPQVCMPDEGGDRGYTVDNRNKKVGRTCYNCGSPDHLVRDCPTATTQNPMYHADRMFQGGMSGYGMPYWNAAAFPPVNPYMNMYGNPGMMPFSPAMVPVQPYGVPPYFPSTYGSLPVPGGNTRMGGLIPVGTRAEQPFRHSENFELQNSDSRSKYSYEKRQRSSDYEDDGIQKRRDYHEVERSSEHKSHRDRGKALSNSEESHGRKLQKDHHYDTHRDQKIKSDHRRYEKRSYSSNDKRDRGSHHTDRTVSGVEDVHSGNHKHDDVRYNKKYLECSRRHHNSRDQSDSDCSCSRLKIKKEINIKRKEPYDGDVQHRHNKDHGFRETRDRKKMVNDSDDEYHHSKRKRVH
ncbi:DWNN domain-containing protein [Artemisia annua]|uniref:DWNN domain-containing protein n=1 Tax=Artemisia annua TaxID=35608 RepID=A0A2U1MPT7_ARTAN|nr:DWNN domain-containing protein [Artemisia annua]